MPKKSNKSFWGGRGRANYTEDKNYFGHDDRTNRSHDVPKFINKPRVSFKKPNYKLDRTDRMRKNMLMKQQLDDDILMSAGSNIHSRTTVQRGKNRSKGITRGRNSPVPHGIMRDGQQRHQSFYNSDTNWYKVCIIRGQKFTKEFVLGNLSSYIAPITFTPIMYKVTGTDAIFFVEDYKVAQKLADCDRKITTSDGFKMLIRVRPGIPQVEISDTLKERLKLAMGKRYVQETNALDLSKFHHDPDLAGDIWCPLARQNMFLAVIDIVREHIPNLGALNLDSNKLQNIEKLGILANKFPNLKILYIGDNKIKDINSLNSIKNLPLEELKLDGNPVCSKYKHRQEDYISDIRKMFPKLLKLDGELLPPPIMFDVEDQKLKLPITQRMFIIQSNARDVASQFLQQYFMVFDSENRQPLLDAYHEHACFSITATISQNSNKFSQYLQESRNLIRVLDSHRRRKLLKQGRLPVVSFISELPRTKHNLDSFTMDLSLVTERMMLITVTGLFKEVHNIESKDLLRYFNKTLIIIPERSGFCISNEQLHINNPTLNQEKQIEYSSKIDQPTAGPSTPSTVVASIVPLSEEIKQQMTMSLSQETNMNVEWSLRCLEEVQWDYKNAQAAFNEAFKLGKIPTTAFIK